MKKEPDVDAMKCAISALVGQHDFSSFRAAGCSAKTTVRHILSADIVHANNDELQIDFVGHGFLRHQVRIMVGTLVDVGLGRTEPALVPTIRDALDRHGAGRTAPAHGLTLVSVELLDQARTFKSGPMGDK